MGRRGSVFEFSLVTLGLLVGWARPAASQVPAEPLVTAIKRLVDVELAWSPDPVATSYNIYRSDDVDTPGSLLASVATPGYIDAGAGEAVAASFYRVHGVSPAGEGPASNLAFKISINLICEDRRDCRERLSLPYLYFPQGAAAPTGRDLCAEYPGATVVQKSLDDGCATRDRQACAGPVVAWTYAAGLGYDVTARTALTLHLVGSNDPEYRPGGTRHLRIGSCPGCAGRGETVVSLPPNAAARTASALCAELAAVGGAPLGIEDYHPASYGSTRYICGSTMPDFAIELGRAYAILTQEAFTWQPALR